MIKTIAMGVGGLIAGIIAYSTREWWGKIIFSPHIGNNENGSSNPFPQIEKEVIEKLSYEHIVKCAEQVIQSKEAELDNIDEAKLVIMPNKTAQDYFNFTISQGQKFFIGEKLTKNEMEKMVVVLITISDDMKDILWGRVYIPDELAEDLSDFVPSDKLYMRQISIK